MKSIMQDYEKYPYCMECGSSQKLEEHHCIGGYGRRSLSEKYGLKILLCGMGGCHYKAHNTNIELYKKWAREAQKAFMEHYNASKDDFIEIFGISFL